jgi:hypothetical protein
MAKEVSGTIAAFEVESGLDGRRGFGKNRCI